MMVRMLRMVRIASTTAQSELRGITLEVFDS